MIRPATEHDLDTIIELIGALAKYERLEHECTPDRDSMRRALFSRDAFVEVLLAEDDQSGQVVGFALFFPNFSIFLGKPGIYLEDLFVRPEHRGRGHGKALLRELARLVVQRGWGRLD